MKQEAFEAQNAELWDEFERWVEILSAVRAKGVDPDVRALIGRDYPKRYRLICHHLAVSRGRRYSAGLQQRLNQLALDGHHYLYRGRTAVLSSIAQFFLKTFPATFRKQWKYMAASTALFYLPALVMAWAITQNPEIIFSLLSPHEVGSMESMYDPDNRKLGRERQSEDDVMMFGYYIYNNVSIGFRTFAGGLLFGIGSVFFLVFNGLFLGAVATHLTMAGFNETFWSFVAGHSALELTAITVFGGAGMMIGAGAIAPGRRKRWHAIRHQAVESLPLVYGGTAMLFAAAFVEAFWSSTTWPPFETKIAIGLALWLLLGIYFGAMGRNR